MSLRNSKVGSHTFVIRLGILNKEETKNSDKGESEKEEIGNSDNVCKDYESETEMLKKKFIVNNENEMSYLVRLKIMGYVGFDFTNTDLYRKKKDFRAGYYIDMDINTKTELSEDFKSDKDGI
ncbi:uncharacterized protein LOC111037154 [Myzus persicae]|uniref:uncharacterized protein LOC111037154 n=1 Tax=Myzus persicae TaxID=13164 RepID=UPI000B932DF2|nr:uncharacterized protein LOC111037154 [Myzus persicae]